MSTTASLTSRHTDATQKLILSSAIELLEQSSVNEVTVRGVAKHAGISERTVFRYYATRDEFLDAVALEATRSMQTPPPPDTLEELIVYPKTLYSRFEEKAALVKAALHTDLFDRIREGVARERWEAVRALVNTHAKHRKERERKIATANIRYYLSATTWHYYRYYFQFTLNETIESAQAAVRLTVNDLVRR
jgi:AcrR family transcriptional regulator